MDPSKYIAAGAVALSVISLGGTIANRVTDKTPQSLTVEAGADAWTKTITAAAQVKTEVAAIPCVREREGTKDGVVLKWFCNGSRLPDKEQTEINNKAGANVVSFVLRPKRDGVRIVYDVADVQGGVLPNLDPVPMPDPVVEAVPVEKPLAEGIKTP